MHLTTVKTSYFHNKLWKFLFLILKLMPLKTIKSYFWLWEIQYWTYWSIDCFQGKWSKQINLALRFLDQCLPFTIDPCWLLVPLPRSNLTYPTVSFLPWGWREAWLFPRSNILCRRNLPWRGSLCRDFFLRCETAPSGRGIGRGRRRTPSPDTWPPAR